MTPIGEALNHTDGLYPEPDFFKPMLTLEFLSEKYKAAVQALAHHPEVSATSGVDFPFTLDMAQAWIDMNRLPHPEELYFVILNEGEPVGGCALRHIDHQKRSAFLGYWIGRQFWGQGFGLQSAQLLRDRAFTTLELETLHALCLKANNEPSARILRKVGFVPDTEREGHIAGGRWGERFPGDVWLYYVLTKDRWRTDQSTQRKNRPEVV